MIENALGLLHADNGNFTRAAAHHREALALLGEGKSADAAHAHNNLGRALSALGDYDGAEAAFDAAVAAFTREFGAEHPLTLTVISNLGSLMNKISAYERSRKVNLELLELRRRVLPDGHPRPRLHHE